MEDWNKIEEMIRKVGETIFFGKEDPYDYLERRDDAYLEYETSKFLDEREKDGVG